MNLLIALASAVALICTSSPATGDCAAVMMTNLTNHPRMDSSPAWSPDGTRIAFRSSRDNVSPWGSTEIYVMDADGSNPTRLTFTDSLFNTGPAWSPDGSKIAFSSSSRTYDERRDDTSQIYVMDADGSHLEPLTHDQTTINGSPVWSPDGIRIVFSSERDRSSNLHIMDADGSNRTLLSPATFRRTQSHFWSPDGDAIVFASTDGNQWDIYLLTVSTGALVNLTDHPSTDTGPTWSPDGRRIAFSSARDPLPRTDPSHAAGDIWVMDRDGSNLTRLTHSPQPHSMPAWSPDGGKIAFMKLTAWYRYDIFVLDLSPTTSVDSTTWGWLKRGWGP